MTLRQLLIGARYFNALAALEFAAKHHTGTRKDGVTPEFDHQVSIALYAMTLPDLMHREEVIATILLHDIREDCGITDHEIRYLFNDSHFAHRVSTAVWNMTKVWRDEKRDEAALFEQMALDPIASIAKGCDRMHNLQTMVGVFTFEKQKTYIVEVRVLFLPMLKAARRNFPQQVLAYENIKHVLLSQIELIEAMHVAVETR
jgi:(p)ppGpp synthase/HD superfamily hydrolase